MPQVEDGYTRIANELLAAMISIDISSQEMRAALFVIRKTYGYNKKEDFIALSQFQKALKISKTRASQIINSLVRKNILTVTENINGLTKKYLFNKHFKEWSTVKEKRNRYVKTQDTVKVLRKTPLRKSVTTKESFTKDTITKEIVSYLNLKAGKNFKPSTAQTKDKIAARLNDGFCLDDFKKVIEVKVSQWKDDEEMNGFLRPETLFGNKFEGYLNEKATSSSQNKPDYDYIGS